MYPSGDHFEGPERWSSTCSVCGHPQTISSSHLEPGGRVDVCFLTHIYAENFTKYFTETVSKIMLG